MLRCSATRAKRPPSARDPPSQSAAPQKTAESISRKPYDTTVGIGPVGRKPLASGECAPRRKCYPLQTDRVANGLRSLRVALIPWTLLFSSQPKTPHKPQRASQALVGPH